MSKPNRTQIAAEYHDRFPNTATRTLARMMRRDEPLLFPSEDRARTALKRARGLAPYNKKHASKEHQREFPKNASTGYPNLPDERREVEAWGPVQVDANKCLILSDIHIPYHENSVLELIAAAAKKRSPDVILLNGDSIDFYGISKFEPDPRERDLAEEIRAFRQFAGWLRGRFKDARIIFKVGNHEERWIRYLIVHAPELLGVEELELENILHLPQHGIEIVKDRRPIRLGKLTVLHGHEYRFAITNPVNPARGLFLRGKTLAMCGHFHQVSQHSEKTLEQKVLTTWSTGCLCYLNPQFMPLNNWSHGAAFVEVDNEGAFDVENWRVLNGKIY